MSETVKVLCYKSKTLSDGKHPLMVRVCKDGKKKYQSLGISIHPSHWDFKKNEPNESCPNRDEIRMLIQQKLFELQKTILSKRIEGKEFTASSLLKPKVASLSLHNNVEECFNCKPSEKYVLPGVELRYNFAVKKGYANKRRSTWDHRLLPAA